MTALARRWTSCIKDLAHARTARDVESSEKRSRGKPLAARALQFHESQPVRAAGDHYARRAAFAHFARRRADAALHPGTPNFQHRTLKRSLRTGCRTQGTHLPFDRLRAFGPLDARLALVDFLGVG